MAKTKQKVQAEAAELQESVQQIFLAGLGALAKAEDEGSKLFKKLVKRGEQYDGPGAEQAAEVRGQLEKGITQLKQRADAVQKQADETARKTRGSVDEQVTRAKRGLDSFVDGFEDRLEKAVTAALHGLGVPTRDEFKALETHLNRLGRNLDAARRERSVEQKAEPNIQAVAVGGGWYAIHVYDLVVDKVQGEEAAAQRVEQLRAQDFPTASNAPAEGTPADTPQEITVEATGGGWYEIHVNGVAVDKVQGKKAAEAAVRRLEQQSA